MYRKLAALLIIGLVLTVACEEKEEEKQEDVRREKISEREANRIYERNVKNQNNQEIVNTPPTLTITSPKGGEVFASRTIPIRWQATDANNDVLVLRISYKTEAGDTIPIERFVRNSGSYEWKAQGLLTGKYAIVMDVNDGAKSDEKETKYFTLK